MIVFKIFYSSPTVFAYEDTVNRKLSEVVDIELKPMPKHFCWFRSHLNTPYGGQMMIEAHLYDYDLTKAGADELASDMQIAITNKGKPLPEGVVGDHVLVTVEPHPNAGFANSH